MDIIRPTLQDCLQIGGRLITDLVNLVELQSLVTTAGNTNGSFRKPGGSAAYQVPASKKFVVVAGRITVYNSTAAAGQEATLLYSDNDVGLGTNTAFTNAVYWGGSSLLGRIGALHSIADYTQEIAIFGWEIPAQKYASVVGNNLNSANISIFGYERSA